MVRDSHGAGVFCGRTGGSLVMSSWSDWSKEVDGSDALAMSSSSGMTIAAVDGAVSVVESLS